MRRTIIGFISAVITALALPTVALAHVVVTPNTAKVGQYVIFAVSVPNEKDSPVTSLKVTLPKGLAYVTPNVAPGFDITTEKSGNDVASITWTGTIPSGQRTDFGFGAQVPASATTLEWKAYQTYADGTTVHWDQKPASTESDDDSSNAGPYSVTTVATDLSSDHASASPRSGDGPLPLVLSIAAIVMSIAGLLIRRRR